MEYNAWLRQDLMTQAVRSIAREGGYTHDLVDKGQAHLPDWASDTVDFVSQAEQYGRQHHTPARVIEVARPREVGKTARGALADCVFHGILPPIPQESCHAIHTKVATDSTGTCHLFHAKLPPQQAQGPLTIGAQRRGLCYRYPDGPGVVKCCGPEHLLPVGPDLCPAAMWVMV